MSKTFPDMIQVVLTKESKRRLEAAIGEGKFPRKLMHHVTLAYKPDLSAYKYVVFNGTDEAVVTPGTEIKIDLGKHLYDDGVEAVAVKRLMLPNGMAIRSLNDNPHITVSVNKDRKPVESNDLFKKLSLHKFEPVHLTLDGVVKFVTHGK